MEKTKVYLFTSPTCPYCPAAKNGIYSLRQKREDFEIIEFSLMTPEGRLNAHKFGISSVPTFIIVGSGYPEPIGLRGSQSEKTMNKYIDLALGKETTEEKSENFIDKIKGLFKSKTL